MYDFFVVDRWSYDYAGIFDGRQDEVNFAGRSIMKTWTGYFNWLMPSDTADNLTQCAALCKDRAMEGIVSYGAFDECFDKNFLHSSELSWDSEIHSDFMERYAYRNYCSDYDAALKALNTVRDFCKNRMWCEGLGALEYYDNCALRAGNSYPGNYPGDVFSRILDSKEEYIDFFEDTIAKADEALTYFENSPCNHKINDYLKMHCLLYKVVANEYYTMIELFDAYSLKQMDSSRIVAALDDLILAREKLMYVQETTKIEANTYQVLRCMSINRQYLIDLKAYFEQCIADGTEPLWNIRDMQNLNGKIYGFLR